MLKQYFSGIWRDRYILVNLVKMDLDRKYKKSILGVFWNILTPLGIVLIIGSIYTILFSADPKVFIPTLFAGLNSWLFVSGTADAGTIALISAEGYLKQTDVNAQIFPLRMTLGAFINFMYSIVAFFLIYLFLQPQNFNINMLFVIPGFIIMFMFSLGIANIAAVINLYVRDFQPLQSLFLQGMFYATPVIFPPEMLAKRGYSFIYEINPFYYIIQVVRAPLLGTNLPTITEYFVSISLALFSFFISIILLMKVKKNIAFKL